ncbi:tRNA(m(1)G37)methyltransferase [Microbotryomycetes sp. JL221]|nr:tRNA(m(1)G37)methyltransferase [Microbotryomycetes sp. JL221]
MTHGQPKHRSTLQLKPPVQRGLKTIDPNTKNDLFTTTLQCKGIRVSAPETTTFLRGPLSKKVLWLPRVTPVISDPSSSQHRIVLLKDEAPDSDELQQVLKDRQDSRIVEHVINLDYDYWTADQILQSILPEDLLDESPTSFTQVGHIAHLNLRDEYLPYRHLIGQVILDKNKQIKTVVNKLDTIDNEFRFFKMEVLAGVEDFKVQTAESGCTFTFDFSKVYWNSRLSTEHGRLVDSFTSNDVVCDAFAGVGPFAVPAGKKGCAVIASDLNPESAKALDENVRINKVHENVRTGNADGRDWIRQSVLDVWRQPFGAYQKPLTVKEQKRLQRQKNEAKRIAAEQQQVDTNETTAAVSKPQQDSTTLEGDSTNAIEAGEPRQFIDHFVMNLPASAIEFLDAYRGLYLPLYETDPEAKLAVEARGYDKLPMVHCYCFTKDVEHAEQDICERATKALGLPVSAQLPDFQLRFVRDVAPKKEMYCLEFRLTKEVVEWQA